MSRRAIAAGGTTPLSAAIIRDGTIYVSGQVGRDPATGAVGDGIREQTQIVINNMRSVLRQCGADLKDVDKCTVFITRQEDFGAMNEVYASMFPEPRPARSTVVVAALARNDFIVEIECVARPAGAGGAKAGGAAKARGSAKRAVRRTARTPARKARTARSRSARRR
jgi:2-iminobutanoate/2-iminopropanoate deaminase